jgi:phage terminase large subunit GpA-like protein
MPTWSTTTICRGRRMQRPDPMQFGNAAELARRVRRSARLLRPPPKLAPSVWAEKNVRIPVGNAIPGPIRFDNAPYQREPLDMIADPTCSRITLMWGAQVGKTMLALCAQGYRIAQDPSSQIMMQPSQGDLLTWLETKFNPTVDANPTLQDLIATPRAREGVNNQRMKSYPGGFIMFSWSGSPKTTRGRSAPFVVCDETDGYDRTAEGHPVSLLWQRAATFGDARKLMEISTPTLKGASWIESAFEAGDRRRFHLACPHCEERQPLQWSNVKWDKAEDGEHLPETAGYACAACGVIWGDGERIAAIRGGVWRAERPWRGHASYHLSELYSCFRPLRDIVQSFLDKTAANDLQTFINVSLAETWEERGAQVDAAGLMARVETFAAPVPQGAAVLTAGIDMQTDRLEVEIVGWGLGEESWSIAYHVLWGDPLSPDVWEALDDLLAQTWAHESGAHLSIVSACLDTGGNGGYPQAAYEYARGKAGRRLFAIKGAGGWGKPIVSAPSRKKSGRRGRGVDLFMVGVDEGKLIVQTRLGIEAPGPGHMHFPTDRDPEWFAQMTAEKLMRRYIKGFPLREWHKTRPRNEALDCRVYAYAALKILNVNIAHAVKRLAPADIASHVAPGPAPVLPAAAPGKPPEDAPLPDPDDAPTPPKRRRARADPRKRKGWVNNW